MATLKAEPGFTYYPHGDPVPKEYWGQFPISALADLQRGGRWVPSSVRS